MGLIQKYTCDKCGHEQPTPDQMWAMRISVLSYQTSNNPYATSSGGKDAMWCRKCVEDMHLLPVPSHHAQRELPPAPTFEDLVREIATQVVQERTGA